VRLWGVVCSVVLARCCVRVVDLIKGLIFFDFF
jgi:hypothetical protein